MVEDSQAVSDFEETLADLQANSKPHINMLTMLAEENQAISSKIVQVIESHAQKVPPVQKLPCLYLIDSIVKNCIETNYKELFSRNIISTFLHVFKEGDEKTRTSMFKLRQTWVGLFVPSKLYGIDIKVNQIDPAWPVTVPQQLKTQSANDGTQANIHVNPKFLQQNQMINQNNNKSGGVNSAPLKPVKTEPRSTHKDKVREDLLRERESELGRLRQRKEELEKSKEKLAQAKSRQQPQSVVTKPTDPRKRAAESGGPGSLKRTRGAMKDQEDSGGSSDDRKNKKKWMDRYQKERRDSEGDEGDCAVSREKSPERKKGKTHKNKNHRKRTPSPTLSSPSAPPLRNTKSLPPKKRIRSDDEMNQDSSAEESRNSVESNSNSPALPEAPGGGAKKDEDLRLLLNQSPPSREAEPTRKQHNIHHNRIPHKDRQNHTHNRPPQTTFNRAAPPTELPGSHAFSTAPRGLLPAPGPGHAPFPAGPAPFPAGGVPGPAPFPSGAPPPQHFRPMGIPPQLNVQNMDVKPPDPIPANNRIFVDGKAYEVKYVEDIPVIERNGQPHKIYFTGPPRDVVVDGQAYSLAFGDKKTVIIDGQPHIIRFGAPGRELYMGTYPFRGAFGGPLIYATINGNRHELRLCGPPPEVKIEPEPCYELIPRMPQRYPTRSGPVHDFGYSEPRQPPPPPPEAQPLDGPAQQLNPHVDLGQLLTRLVSAGVITGTPEETGRRGLHQGGAGGSHHGHWKRGGGRSRPQTPPIPSGHHFKDEEEVERQSRPPPNLKDFSVRVFKVRYKSVVDSLYPTKQTCPNCGLRFEDIDEQRYRRHLDWHFRENAKAKDTSRGSSRPWYFAAEDWINYTEQGDDPATKAKSSVFEGSGGPENGENREGLARQPVVIADSIQTACSVCDEAFENFYDDDEDTWKCRNAMIVDGKLFHPLCYQDVSMAQGSTDPAFTVQRESSYSVLPGLDTVVESEVLKTEPISSDLIDERSVVLSEINTQGVNKLPVTSEGPNNPMGVSTDTTPRVKVEVPDEAQPPSADGGLGEKEAGTPVQDEVALPESVPDSERQRSPGTPLRDEMT